MEKEISVVIPCLNEEATIGICIDKCKQVFQTLNIDGEIIISDNGSTDSSVKIANEKGAKVIFSSPKGYGNALQEGFKHACGKYIIMGDADNTYNFLEIPLFYNKINEKTDMIIGSRLKGKIHKGAMPFLHRYIGTPILTFLINILYGTNISDSNSGFRLIRKSSLDNIEFQTSGMDFASELIIKFAKKQYNIDEINISLHKDAEGRIPHLNTFSDGFRNLKCIVLNKI